ncbi:MAG: hypothetical protein KAW12_03990 [Candidatus Aminicenantes bacterium]|nr:hypothetical protein [Candidatus Aminicenantes bacterium]
MIECDGCHELVWESEIQVVDDLAGDENGMYSYELNICQKCIDDALETEAEAASLGMD